MSEERQQQAVALQIKGVHWLANASMSKPKRIVILLVLLIILTILLLIPLAKEKINTYLEESLGAKIGRISISLFTASIILDDLAIEDILSVKQVVIKPELKSLLHKRFTVSKIILDSPHLTLHIFGTKPPERILIPANEILIKDGALRYNTVELHGIFIHLKNYPSPISHTQDTPFFTRIKGRGYLSTEPKGTITISGNVNLAEPQISFTGDISMENISLTYFNNFYPEDSQVQVISGEFSLSSQVQCIRGQLMAKPDVTVRNLQLKLTQDYTTGDVFELPGVLVVDFFDLYKEELKFTFEVSGSLSNPEFKLGQVVSEQVSEVIGASIVRTIATSPTLIVKLGDKLAAIADKLKEFGLDLVGKPAKELIKGLKGE